MRCTQFAPAACSQPVGAKLLAFRDSHARVRPSFVLRRWRGGERTNQIHRLAISQVCARRSKTIPAPLLCRNQLFFHAHKSGKKSAPTIDGARDIPRSGIVSTLQGVIQRAHIRTQATNKTRDSSSDRQAVPAEPTKRASTSCDDIRTLFTLSAYALMRHSTIASSEKRPKRQKSCPMRYGLLRYGSGGGHALTSRKCTLCAMQLQILPMHGRDGCSS